MSSKVSRALFRSLLRWNRRNAITEAKFSIDPAYFDLESVLPPNTVIQDAPGVQAALFYAFRSTTESSKAIDHGFKTLKLLNEYQKVIKDDYGDRCLHSSDMVQQIVQYRIGQVVQYKTSKVRGIVIGWKVNLAKQTQQVEILVDTLDYNYFSEVPYKFKPYVNSSDLELVTDPLLKRVNNADCSDYFVSYDENIDRFIANERMMYLYPRDYEDITSSQTTEASSSWNREVFDKVHTHVQHLIDEVIDTCNASFPWRQQSLSSHATDAEINRMTITNEILDSIWQQIDKLKSVGQQSQQQQPFRQQLRRGSRQLQIMLKQQAALTSPPLPAYAHVQQVDGLYIQLEHLAELMNRIDQLLQLRFQHATIAFRYCLQTSRPATQSSGDSGSISKVPFHASVNHLIKELQSPPITFQVGSVLRHKKFHYRGVISGVDQRPQQDVSSWEGVVGLPSGQEQPFYRVIPDEKDVDRFIGEGVYRPFYYVAQENLEPINNLHQLLISHRNINSYFLGWDAEQRKFRLRHLMKYGFPSGIYSTPEAFPVRLASQEYYDHFIKSEKEGQVKEEIQILTEQIHLEELKIYEDVDTFLLRLGEMTDKFIVDIRKAQQLSLKRSGAGSRKSASATAPTTTFTAVDGSSSEVTADDLLVLLKQAPHRQASLATENFLYRVSMSHENHNVNACMKIGVAALQRGAYDRANDAFELATTFDKNFAEAYNKLAASNMAMGDHLACKTFAKKALKLSPQHFGAMTGLALGYEKSRKKDKAVQFIKAALALNPWASNLPTKLKSILEI